MFYLGGGQVRGKHPPPPPPELNFISAETATVTDRNGGTRRRACVRPSVRGRLRVGMSRPD